VTDPLLVRQDGPILRLTLNRPERRNALNAALKAALLAALDRIEADPPPVLVLEAAGPAFCAGQDLSERAGTPAEGRGAILGASLREVYGPLVRRLRDLPCVSIAAVQGTASGAGAGLALACDIVLAAKSARFAFPFGGLGLAPDAGVAWFLARALGPARARAHLMTGLPLGAAEAQAAGLVWQVTEDSALDPAALALAADLAARPLPALLAARALVDAAPGRDLAAHLQAEALVQERLGDGPDYGAALAAFLARREER
jgi:2-(1,2-epoxy-1,2-dihydrophenyl)acetyl-CoA isomerase